MRHTNQHIICFAEFSTKNKRGPTWNVLKNRKRRRRRQKLETPGVVYMSITLPLLDKNLYYSWQHKLLHLGQRETGTKEQGAREDRRAKERRRGSGGRKGKKKGLTQPYLKKLNLSRRLKARFSTLHPENYSSVSRVAVCQGTHSTCRQQPYAPRIVNCIKFVWSRQWG